MNTLKMVWLILITQRLWQTYLKHYKFNRRHLQLILSLKANSWKYSKKCKTIKILQIKNHQKNREVNWYYSNSYFCLFQAKAQSHIRLMTYRIFCSIVDNRVNKVVHTTIPLCVEYCLLQVGSKHQARNLDALLILRKETLKMMKVLYRIRNKRYKSLRKNQMLKWQVQIKRLQSKIKKTTPMRNLNREPGTKMKTPVRVQECRFRKATLYKYYNKIITNKIFIQPITRKLKMPNSRSQQSNSNKLQIQIWMTPWYFQRTAALMTTS